LSAIHDQIAIDSERYALRVVDRLTRRSQQIAQFPNSGRMVPELQREDIREVIEPRNVIPSVARDQGGRGIRKRGNPVGARK
jgi:plasmid stabilization system protein ParE